MGTYDYITIENYIIRANTMVSFDIAKYLRQCI